MEDETIELVVKVLLVIYDGAFKVAENEKMTHKEAFGLLVKALLLKSSIEELEKQKAELIKSNKQLEIIKQALDKGIKGEG
jgi:hypothetical protein